MATENKQKGNYNCHAATQEESRLIKKHADKWCRDNGYPIQRRKYWEKRKGAYR